MMSIFSCREFAKRCSRECDAPLQGWDRFAYRFHYLLCFVCRRFSKQMEVMDKTLHSLSEANAGPELAEERLSPEAALRIKECLQEQDHHH